MFTPKQISNNGLVFLLLVFYILVLYHALLRTLTIHRTAGERGGYLFFHTMLWRFYCWLFLSRFSITNIHDSEDSRWKGRLSLWLFSTTFTPLHRHLNISRVINAQSSLLHIASSPTWTWNLPFSSASR